MLLEDQPHVDEKFYFNCFRGKIKREGVKEVTISCNNWLYFEIDIATQSNNKLMQSRKVFFTIVNEKLYRSRGIKSCERYREKENFCEIN